MIISMIILIYSGIIFFYDEKIHRLIKLFDLFVAHVYKIYIYTYIYAHIQTYALYTRLDEVSSHT